MSRKSGLSSQVVFPDRFSLHEIQWKIEIFRNWKTVFPDGVVVPGGGVHSRQVSLYSIKISVVGGEEPLQELWDSGGALEISVTLNIYTRM